MARYTKTAVTKLVQEIEAWIESTEDTIIDINLTPYPNEKRKDSLGTRINFLQDAKTALIASQTGFIA